MAFGGAVIVTILLVASLAPFLAPYDPLKFDIVHKLQGPSALHWMGTDEFGHDILSRIIYGARASMQVALGAAILSALIGVPLGLLGGYFAGIVELFTLRLTDVIVAFPPIVLALLFVTLFGPGLGTLTLAIAFLFVPSFARITYGEVLAIKRVDYVEAARALGASDGRIILRAILPAVVAPIIVQFSLTVAAAILLESGLSFLGLGVVPPTPSWGLMISASRGYMLQDPWYLLWPCIAIVATIVALNVAGDAVRDRLDPRLRRAGAAPGRR